jgi:tripartite-type tricarboxylate transporter receptor subunit TctC
MNKIKLVLSALLVIGLTAPAAAQTWPSKQIRMIVPYAPGGYTDYMGRTVSQKLSEALGQQFVVENRPGANSVIGADAVAKAAPDGYTLGTVIAGHTANASLNSKLPFDVLKDFTYVSLITTAPLLLVVRKDLPVGNLSEFIAYAKSNPGRLTFGSSGIGSAAHIIMEAFQKSAGIKLLHVPYKGTAPALTDLLAGTIDVQLDTLSAFTEHLSSGNLKAIVVTSRDRMPITPDVPTMTELGFTDFVSGSWAGIIAPANTPKDIVDRIAKETAKAIQTPEMKESLAKQGYVVVGSTPEEFDRMVREEVARMGKIIREANIKLE